MPPAARALTRAEIHDVILAQQLVALLDAALVEELPDLTAQAPDPPAPVHLE